MDIKDFLGEYVKPQALKLGGEGAINEVDAGLDGLQSSIQEPSDWNEEQVVLEQTEGQRLVIKGEGFNPVNLYGGTLNLGYLPVSGGGNNGASITNMVGLNQLNLISTGQIDISSQSNNGQITLRAGSSASVGIQIQSNAAGVGELKILLSDINGDAGLPTGTASLVANQLWNDNGTLKIYTP